MYHAVFFDIDNTLLLKKPSISDTVYEIARRTISDLQFEMVERAYAASEIWQGEQIRLENETGTRMPDDEYLANVVDVYRRFLDLGPVTCRELTEIFSQGNKATYSLAPGTREVLALLKERRVPMGIISNNHTGIRQVLENQGIAKYFAPIIISEEVGLYKPDPEILKLACTQAGVSPQDCVYVGDHPFDILCAHEANMAAIWLPANRFMEVPSYIGTPEYTISSLGELLNIIS